MQACERASVRACIRSPVAVSSIFAQGQPTLFSLASKYGVHKMCKHSWSSSTTCTRQPGKLDDWACSTQPFAFAVRWEQRDFTSSCGRHALWTNQSLQQADGVARLRCHDQKCAATIVLLRSCNIAFNPLLNITRRKKCKQMQGAQPRWVQMCQEWALSRCRCIRGGPSLGAEVATVSPVPVRDL